MRTHTIDPPIIRVNSYFLINAMDKQIKDRQLIKFLYSDEKMSLPVYISERDAINRNISYLDKLIDGLGE